MTDKTITIADAGSWRMREEVHYNGGPAFFAYLYRCIEQPRLTRYDRYDKKTRKATSTWRTDGVDQPSLEAAIAALNTPPAFTAEELTELGTVTEEFTDIRKTMDLVLNDALTNKGAVEWQKGRCRLTEIGKAALARGSRAWDEAQKELGNG